MILIGDIGGTNSRFALVKPGCSRFFSLKVFKNKSYHNFYEVLEVYLSSLKNKKPVDIAVLAVAGPVLSSSVHLTNLNWNISCKTLKRRFGFKEVYLVNDLYALAAGGAVKIGRYCESLKKGKRLSSYPKAFIAPGTGLGEAILVKGNPITILPTEGGHLFFSSLTKEEFEYLEFLKNKGEELSWEKALSGPAISYWYEFYFDKLLSPEEVTTSAKLGDSKARKVMKKFFNLLGRKTSQVALFSLPSGGIFLAGGVIAGIKELFLEKEFKDSFFSGYFQNEKMKGLIERFSISLYTNHPHPVLLGALVIAQSLLK